MAACLWIASWVDRRTPDGRAWYTCQFLPTNFSPSAPLGLMFDSVACRQSTVKMVLEHHEVNILLSHVDHKPSKDAPSSR